MSHCFLRSQTSVLTVTCSLNTLLPCQFRGNQSTQFIKGQRNSRIFNSRCVGQILPRARLLLRSRPDHYCIDLDLRLRKLWRSDRPAAVRRALQSNNTWTSAHNVRGTSFYLLYTYITLLQRQNGKSDSAGLGQQMQQQCGGKFKSWLHIYKILNRR